MKIPETGRTRDDAMSEICHAVASGLKGPNKSARGRVRRSAEKVDAAPGNEQRRADALKGHHKISIASGRRMLFCPYRAMVLYGRVPGAASR